MASGTINLTKSGSGNMKGRIVWSSTSNGAIKNSSTVTASLQVARTDSYTTYGTWKGNLNIGGTNKDVSWYGSVSSSWVEVYSFSITKAHSSNGSGSCYISGKCNAPTETKLEGTSVSGSATVTLDTIPRASSISATNANIGSATKITIDSKNSSFTHTLTYEFEGLTGTIATKTSNNPVNWTVPTSFYAKIPNAKYATCKITCSTYSGNTKIGDSTTTTFRATASESACKPTLNPSVEDKGAVSITLTGSPTTKIIKGYNSCAVNTGAAARNGATLKSYSITCGDKSIKTASGALAYVNSGKFVFTATDSRGYSTSETVNLTLIEYIKPTCSVSVSQPSATDTSLNFTIKGDFFNGSFGAVNNALTVQYRYKVNDGSYSAWTAASATISGSTYKASGAIANLDYRSTYTIEARVLDKIYNGNTEPAITSAEVKVKTTPIFDWGENDFNFNVDIKAQENLIFKNGGVGIRGTTTDGEEIQAVQPCNSNNNCVFGFGGYDKGIGATNLYGNDVNILTNSDLTVNGGGGVYSLLGLAKLMSSTITLPVTVTPGSGYSNCSASATIVGGMLRMYMTATRSTNANAGDISNETVMTINVEHNGKLSSIAGMSFVNGSTGATANFQATTAKVNDNVTAITVSICGTGVGDNGWNSQWAMPCAFNLAAFV